MSTKDIYDKYKYDRSIVDKSSTWFKQQIALLRNERINLNTFHKTHGVQSPTIVPGNMYMFFYDPKHKETLPHYDMFPLVFPFEKTKNGFVGLNMHYLPYQLRIALFDNLIKYRGSSPLDERTVLAQSWGTIKSLSHNKLAKMCVKQYLTSHIQSQIKKVSPSDWTTTLMLPVESFAKATKNQIWRQ